MIFCSVFNGDCHPGNVLLLDDGRLGLIDYGQVKNMSIEERINYAHLIKAHAVMDKAEVVRLHFDVLGTKTKYRNEDIGYLFSAFYNDRNSDDVCGGMNIKSFIDSLEVICSALSACIHILHKIAIYFTSYSLIVHPTPPHTHSHTLTHTTFL